jgi:hypothetical protein
VKSQQESKSRYLLTQNSECNSISSRQAVKTDLDKLWKLTIDEYARMHHCGLKTFCSFCHDASVAAVDCLMRTCDRNVVSYGSFAIYVATSDQPQHGNAQIEYRGSYWTGNVLNAAATTQIYITTATSARPNEQRAQTAFAGSIQSVSAADVG